MSIFSDQKIREIENELRQVTEAKTLLVKLYHHHMSQSKPKTHPCSREYNEQLAGEIKALIWRA